MDLLKGLNPKQKEGVLTTEGPVLLLAGAGSGKTRVLTNRIAYILQEEKAYSGSILAITFTNKAANEMKERVAKLLKDENVDRMWIGTFHSICVRILRRDIDKIGYTRSFTIYDRADQITLIRECIKELNLNKDMFKESSVLARISKLKDQQITSDEFINENYKNYHERNIGEIYSLYVKKLKQYNALDFDDLLLKALALLKQEKDILHFYQGKFKYIFVDEYQDTNRVQYELVKLLAQGYGNICVVGDPDQSIYGWRGADIRNIMDFEKDYKEAKTIFLEQNYRSTQNILNVANRVINNNPGRFDKKLWTENNKGEGVEYEEVNHSDEEGQYVANKIHHLLYDGYKLEDIAILYRTNAQSRIFEDVLIGQGMRYKIVGGLKFYDRKEVKDIIAYLKILENPHDNISLKRIINTPKRSIGLTSIERLEDYANSKLISIYDALKELDYIDSLNKRAKNSIKTFKDLIYKLENLKDKLGLKELVEEVINSTKYIIELRKEDTIEAQTRIENVEEFLSMTADFESKGEDISLEDFLATISLMSDIDKTEDTDNVITLMTVHSAKGLEFPVVFLVGMEEGLFPNGRAFDNEEDMEEERRLCYVAVTRAEKKLYLTSARNRTIYGRTEYCSPSRFIEEMGDSLKKKDKKPIFQKPRQEKKEKNDKLQVFEIKTNKAIKTDKKAQPKDILKVGDKVNHKAWGPGMVVQITPKEKDQELTISFDKKGIKRVLESLAPIEKLR